MILSYTDRCIDPEGTVPIGAITPSTVAQTYTAAPSAAYCDVVHTVWGCLMRGVSITDLR